MSNTFTYSNARKHLAEILTRAVKDNEVLTITRRNEEDVVVLSKSEYDAMSETLHLFSSPTNAARLIKAIDDAKSGKNMISMDIHALKKAVNFDGEKE